MLNKAICYLFSAAILLRDMHGEKAGNNSGNLEIKIVKEGTGVVIECRSCNGSSLVWTHKPPNGVPADIVTGKEAVRKDNQAEDNQWFNIAFDNNICVNTLQIHKIQINKAGVYTCLKDLNIMRTYVIVIKENFRCFSEPDFPKTILLKANSTVTIICTFEYSADESCIVTPIWTDLTGYRNLNLSDDDDFEVKMDNLHASIHFKSGVDILNGTRLNLSFVFSCSFSNNSQDKYEVRSTRYDFGQVPFTLLVEVEKENIFKDRPFDPIVTWSWYLIAAASAVVIISLFLMYLKKSSKLCFAINHRRSNNENSSGVQKEGGYIGIKHDPQNEEIQIYEVINDSTYEVLSENVDEC